MEDTKDILEIDEPAIEASEDDTRDDAPKGKYEALTSAEDDVRRLTGM